MRALLLLFLLTAPLAAAVKTTIGNSDNKTTIGTPGQQTTLFAQMTNQTSVSVSCWVKYDWTDAGVNSQLGGGAKQGLLSKGRFEQSGASGELQFGLSSVSEKIGFSFSSPNTTYHIWNTTANTVQTNTWMHLASTFTYSNGASIHFYINGAEQAGSWGTGTGNAVGQTNNVSFHTFIYQQNGGSSFFGGAMSDLAIWTNALSPGEILKLAKGKMKGTPLQIQPSQLLFYWPMDTNPIFENGSHNNVDLDRTAQHFNLDMGGIGWGERALSYQPNE